MSVTEQQKDYHLRKMRINLYDKNGHQQRWLLVPEDYNLMAKQLAEHGRLTEKQADSAYSGFMVIADTLSLKPGIKHPLQEAIQRASMSLLSMQPEERKEE